MFFNFNRLHPLFVEAIQRHEPTIAFPLSNGQGRFVFLIFISTNKAGEIKWGDLELFIILGRTQQILSFDLKGNHYHTGDFKISITDQDEQAIRHELGIENATQGGFSFSDFLPLSVAIARRSL